MRPKTYDPSFRLILCTVYFKEAGFVALCQNRSENRREWSKEAGTKVLASQLFFGLSSQDAVVEWALLRWFHQLLQPYSTVRRWDDEIEF